MKVDKSTLFVLIADSPNGRDLGLERERTACPKTGKITHCHCSADEHYCEGCDKKW